MSKSVIQQAREALSHLESEAHSLGMRSEYRHDLARQIRAGLEQAARAGGEQAPIVWINPANIRRTMIASPGETVEVSAYREGEFTAPLYTHPPAKVPEYRTARDFYESDDFLLAQDIDACEQQAEGWNKCRQAMLAHPPAGVPEVLECPRCQTLMKPSERSFPDIALPDFMVTNDQPAAKVPEGWLVRRVDDRITVQHPDFGGYCAAKEPLAEGSQIAPVILYHLAEALLATPAPATGTDPEWIKCSDYPQPTIEASICFSMGNARDKEPHIRIRCPILENCSDVTHWMPLPNPPQQEGNQ